MDEVITRAIMIIGGGILAGLFSVWLPTLLSWLDKRNMNVGKRLRPIFMAPKKRRVQKLVSGLSSQLSKLYEDAVTDALLRQDADLLDIHGTGQDLAVDLSAEGVDKLMDNLPPSIDSLLNTEGVEVRKDALELLMTFENYKTIDDLGLHPIVREVMIRLLQGETGRAGSKII